MGPFRQRGPDDERMNELEPLCLVLRRSIHPVAGDAASGISKGEEASVREHAEPNPMRAAGTHLGRDILGRARVYVDSWRIWSTFMPLVRLSAGSHEDREEHPQYKMPSFPEENTRVVVWVGSNGRALTLGGLGNKAAWPAGASSYWRREKGQRTVLPEERAAGRKQ